MALNNKNMTASDLAYKLGISKANFSKYKSGLTSPEQSTIEAIADILNVPPQWLIGWDNSTKPSFLSYGGSNNPKKQALIELIDNLPDDKIDLLISMIKSWQ